MGHQPINPTRALWMKTQLNLSWREIGVRLAQETGRDGPFQGNSVQRTVKKYQKENLRCLLKSDGTR